MKSRILCHLGSWEQEVGFQKEGGEFRKQVNVALKKIKELSCDNE